MDWKTSLSERIGGVLRFTVYLFFALDGILLSVFLFWFLVKFIWRLSQFIDFHLFKNPWF